MVTFTTEQGSTYSGINEKEETTTNVDDKVVIKEEVTAGGKNKVIEENVTNTDDGSSKQITYTTQKTATPLSVFSSFSEGFIDSIAWLPDTTISKFALGISDTYNLGWSEDDIFSFSDLINKHKLGYMSGSTGVNLNPKSSSGFSFSDEFIKEDGGEPENEWERWAHLSGEISGLGITFFTGAGYLNAMSVPMKYRKMVQVSPGKFEWQTDVAKVAAANKKFPALTGAGQDYLNWIANNPLKAAQLDLMFSTGAATGIYTADRQLTDEFREEHPVLSSLIETGAMVVGSLTAPVVMIGTSKGLRGGGILLKKLPGTGTVLKFSGNILNKLLSLGSIKAQREYIRSLQDQVDGAVYNQIKDVWQAAINDPASVIPRNIAIVTKQQIVGGDAIKALRAEFANTNMNEAEISTKLFEMLANTETRTIMIGNKEFEVGTLAEAALKAYENSLRTAGTLSELEILQAIQNQRLQLSVAQQAPSAKNIKTQMAIEAKASAEQLNTIVDRKSTNENVVKGFYENMFVTDEHAPLIVLDHLSGRIIQSNAIKKEILDSPTALAEIAEASAIKPLSGAEAVSQGQGVRTIIETNRKKAMEPFVSEDSYINEVGVGIEVTNFKQLQDLLKTKIFGPHQKATYFEDPETLPLVIKRILDTPAGEKLNLLDIWKLYTSVTNQLFDAQMAKSAGMGGKEAYSNLYLTQQALMDFMKNKMVPLRKFDDGTARTLDKFFTDYKTQVADIYNKGAVFKMNKIQPGGGYLTPPEKIASEFLANSDTAKNFKVLIDNIVDVAERKEMNDAVRNVILDKIYNAGIINKVGAIDPIRLNKWMDKNDSWLQFFPDLKNSLTNSRKMTTDLGNRIHSLKLRHENIEKNFVREKLKPIIDIVNAEIRTDAAGAPIITGEPKDQLIYTVNGLIKKALNDPILMRKLRDAVGIDTGGIPNKDASNAFRDLVWKNVGDNIKLESPAAVKEWMESAAGEQILKLIYNPSQAKALKTLLNAYETLYRIPDPAAIAETTPPGIKKIQEQLGSSVQNFSSILRAYKEGRISGRNTFIYLASRLFSTQQKRKIQALYFEAFSNPDVAEFLSKDLFINYKINSKNGFGYFTELNKSTAHKLSNFVWTNIGMKIPVEQLMEPPVILSDSTEYTIDAATNTDGVAIPNDNVEQKDLDSKSKASPININIPNVVPASKLSDIRDGPQIEVGEAETLNVPGEQITQEQFTSYFPYDTTGQMIAARRASEGGIINALPNTRQRVL
jgi:hypothetical protein